MSSFGAGFVMLLASGKGSCVAVVERCVDVELLSSSGGLNRRGVKNGDHEPEKPAFIDPIFSENQSAEKMGKFENYRFYKMKYSTFVLYLTIKQNFYHNLSSIDI